MNNKLKENCKRKLVQLGEKVKQLDNHKSILLNISSELDKRTNIKLNNLLFDADLQEEISYLNDWIGFYSKEIEKYEAKLRNLDRKIIEEMQKAKETKSPKLQIEKGIKDSFKFIFREAEEPKDEIKAEKAAKKSIKEKILNVKNHQLQTGGMLIRKGYSVVFEHLKNVRIFDDHRKSLDFRDARKYTLIYNNIGITSISQRLMVYFRHIKERFSGFKAQKPIIWYIAPLAILLLLAASLFLLKPDITGYTILGKETAYKDILSLKINESGTYEWVVKSPGDIKSIKAAGSVVGNGSVKIYIEKDGKRYLVYKNK